MAITHKDKQMRHFDEGKENPFTWSLSAVRDMLSQYFYNPILGVKKPVRDCFKRNFTNCKCVGLVVRHNGTSSRSGWIGVVVKVSENHIGVFWLFDKEGNHLLQHGSYNYNQFGVYQSYSLGWCLSSMQAGKLSNFTINDVVKFKSLVLNSEKDNGTVCKSTSPEQDKGEEAMYKEETGQFIIWCKNGKTNPKVVHTSKAEAKQAARAMTKRHNNTFYVAKLVAMSKPVVEVTSRMTDL